MSARAVGSPPFVAVRRLLSISTRGLARTGRTLALAAIATLPILVAIAQRIDGEESSAVVYADLLAQLIIPTVVAFVALVLAASAIGDDREDGTILFLVATSIPRSLLVASKAVAAWLVSMLVLIPSLVATATILGQTSAGALAWPLIAVALVSAAYAGIFTWVSLLTRRAIIVGAVYVLLWEGTIATFADSADRLSLAAYGRRIAAAGVGDIDAPAMGLATAIIVLAAAAVVGVWLGARALRRVELP